MHFSMRRSSSGAKAIAVCAITASLCAAASCAEANRGTQGGRRSASAALHLTVFVLPVLQAGPETAPKRQESSITFTLASPSLTKTYEERLVVSAENRDAGKQQPAILRTFTFVPK